MKKTISIMQPYFFPYIGYWQLLHQADEFVIYDNIKFTKKGWIHRNRFLCEDKDKYFLIQLEKASDFLDVRERTLSPTFERKKLLNQIREAYRVAPYYNQINTLFEEAVMCKEQNLFEYIFHSVKLIAKCLGIETKIVVSSHIDIDHSLKASQKVIAICKNLDASCYVNPIGGLLLSDKKEFATNGIVLKFLKQKEIIYSQKGNPFVPSLSILDVLMFNGVDRTKSYLNFYQME
jgi:hypothetical protein